MARKKFLNEHAFDIITDESAYWLGLLMADGNICHRNKPHNTYTLSLEMKDKEHIEKFKIFMQAEHTIFPHRNIFGISLPVKNYANRLSEFGIIPNKSLNAEVKLLQNNRHFWRGVIDGDGCLGNYKAGFTLVMNGSKILCNQFYQFVKQFCPKLKATVRKMTAGNLYVLQITGTNAKIISNILYSNSLVYLDRKFDIAKRYF